MSLFANKTDKAVNEPVDLPGGIDLLNLTGNSKRLALFLIWTLLGLSEAIRLYYRYNIVQDIYTWGQTLYWGLAAWYLWGLLSPVIAFLVRRITFGKSNWVRPVLIHLAAALSLSLVQLILDACVVHFGTQYIFVTEELLDQKLLDLIAAYLRFMLQRGVLSYFMIALVIYMVQYYRQFRAEERRRSAVEKDLLTSQLETLRGQLQPHFLFNTLNTVAELIHADPDLADQVITKLSEMLRLTLDTGKAIEVPLREEMEFIDLYLDINEIRFEERLQVTREIHPETLDLFVPTLITQPIVENSIKHGVSSRVEGAKIAISSTIKDKQLVLRISDDGPGLGSDYDESTPVGIGLKNTRARLEQLYGDEHSFSISDMDGGGVEVVIVIPVRHAGSPTADGDDDEGEL